ncbi:MAG: tyrosine--tRNA ligase [Bernardetiaceae bacterium]
MKNLFDELRWRGMLHNYIPETEEALLAEPIRGYIGFDPTADSLHIGNLATVMLLVHLQRAGHQPIALVGGATGMVGDPSGKSAERNLLDEEQLRHNEGAITEQLRQFLDFEAGPQSAEVVNNYDWFKDFGFLQFLREVGKNLTINYMIAKDSVQKRLETGISFTEFSYQLLQGYDFYYLNKHKNVRLQMGGSDQWGNITTGTELIRRMGGTSAYALTCPLVTKADGQKFGKSESGNVWLDHNRTSPYKFYQFWLNVADEEAAKLARVFTLLDREQIESLETAHQADPGQRILQRAIAEDVTVRVHGREAYQKATEASAILFGKKATEALGKIDEPTLLAVLEGVPQVMLSRGEYANTHTITDLLTGDGRVFASKGEARRFIQGGGLRINKEKVSDPQVELTFALLQNKYLLIEKGNKNKFLFILMD